METGNMGPGSGMMTGSMMTNGGSFGMMNGMAGSPVVGEDGTAYLVSYVPSSTPSQTPSSNSFDSKLIAVAPSGTISSMALSGIVSKPVVLGNLLFASASLPDFNDYTMFGSFGSNPPNNQSVFYIVQLPLAGSAKPIAVALDGSFASAPVVDSVRNRVIVTTTDFGNSMMSGSYSYNMMYGSYNANSSTAKTYMYMINFDGTFTKITIQ
ncbi:MAG: hypothetical protein V1844_27355 [Pseudomonadota bacterium]